MQDKERFTVEDLNSPVSTATVTVEDCFGAMYRPEELVCCCMQRYDKGIAVPGWAWIKSDKLSKYQYLVCNPVVRLDTEHPRFKTNIKYRKYVVTEMDSGAWNQQAALIDHLRQYAPLVCVCTSGDTGKSLHAYWSCEGVVQWKVERFFDYCVRLGADFHKWDINGLSRLPKGWRKEHKDGIYHNSRQEIVFFDPSKVRK